MVIGSTGFPHPWPAGSSVAVGWSILAVQAFARGLVVPNCGCFGRFLGSLFMYDRQTESGWSHFTVEAIAGHLAGARLETIPLSTVSWDAFRSALGRAVDGPLAGEQLEAVVPVDTFWFAWAAFRPDTAVVR